MRACARAALAHTHLDGGYKLSTTGANTGDGLRGAADIIEGQAVGDGEEGLGELGGEDWQGLLYACQSLAESPEERARSCLTLGCKHEVPLAVEQRARRHVHLVDDAGGGLQVRNRVFDAVLLLQRRALPAVGARCQPQELALRHVGLA